MAKELWIGVDADGATFLHLAEPKWWRGEWVAGNSGATFLGDLHNGLPLGIPPGHKARLVLDEASVTKGGE